MRELNLHHAGENQSYISKPPSTINTQKKLLSTATWTDNKMDLFLAEWLVHQIILNDLRSIHKTQM